jgi:hypothetical protein
LEHSGGKAKVNDDSWYGLIGNLLGGLGAIIAFFGSWWYCAATYGYLFGFGLGWIPSFILAIIVFAVLRWLWPLIALGIFLLLNEAFSNL